MFPEDKCCFYYRHFIIRYTQITDYSARLHDMEKNDHSFSSLVRMIDARQSISEKAGFSKTEFNRCTAVLSRIKQRLPSASLHFPWVSSVVCYSILHRRLRCRAPRETPGRSESWRSYQSGRGRTSHQHCMRMRGWYFHVHQYRLHHSPSSSEARPETRGWRGLQFCQASHIQFYMSVLKAVLHCTKFLTGYFGMHSCKL